MTEYKYTFYLTDLVTVNTANPKTKQSSITSSSGMSTRGSFKTLDKIYNQAARQAIIITKGHCRIMMNPCSGVVWCETMALFIW